MAAGRPPENRRAAMLLAVTLVVLPCRAAAGTNDVSASVTPTVSLPGPARVTSPLVLLSIETQIGYDNDLLADPDGVGVLEPVASGLATIGPVVRLRRAGLRAPAHRDRCEAQVEAGISGYTEQALGADRNVRGSALYQMELSPRTLLEGSATYLYFRREELPVYDVDAPEAHLRLARASGNHWLFAAEATYARPVYPGRELDDGGYQQDDRYECTGSFLRNMGRHSYLATRASWRTVDSNDPYVVQHGPLVELRAGTLLAGRVWCVASSAYSERAYPNYPVLPSASSSTASTDETRHDQVLQLGIAIERGITSRVTAYAQALGVHQWSNVEELAFGQARFVLGCQVELWRAGTEEGRPAMLPVPIATPDPLAPEVRGTEVTFKVRAAEAQQVALVGGFNGWDEHRQPMQGPDDAGIWRLTATIPPGSWRYSFVVDGKWVRPEGAPRYEEDGFGAENGVLDVDAPAALDPVP
jgi:hypothetical protein